MYNTRYILTLIVNLITLDDLTLYKPTYDYRIKEWTLHVDDKKIRVIMRNRLWFIDFDLYFDSQTAKSMPKTSAINERFSQSVAGKALGELEL